VRRPCPRRSDIAEALTFEEPKDPRVLAHIGDCADCREEYEQLATVAQLVASRWLPTDAPARASLAGAGHANPGANVAEELPPGLTELLQRVRSRRRRRLAGVATVAAICAGLGFLLVPTKARPAVVTAARAGSVSLKAAMWPKPWGTYISVDVAGVPRHLLCELVVLGKDQPAQPDGWWWSAKSRLSGIGTATSMHLGQISAIELRVGGKLALVDRL
jgi:hypothetical protein